MVLSAKAQSLDSIQHITEIVVTTKPTGREVIPSQKLSGESLQRLNALSVADAMRYFSGIQLKDYGGTGGIKTVDIRSMGTHHLGIFYDGIELGNAQNGQIDLGQLSLDNIDEITLYNGQKSAIFQPASDFGNAGSVYIRTRYPRFQNGKKHNLKLIAKYGESHLFKTSALLEQCLSEVVNLSVNAGFLNSDGKYRFSYKRVTPSGDVAYDTTATRQNGDIHAERAEINVNGLLQRGLWNLKYYLYNSERGIPGAIVNNVWRRGERQNDFNTFVQGRFQKDLSDRLSTQWLAKYAYYRTHYINNDSTQLPVDNRYWQQEVYLSTANVYEILPNWSASASYDLRWNKLNADSYRFAYPTRMSHLVSLATALDYKVLKIQGSVLATFVHDHLRNGSNNDLSKLTPALFVNVYPFRDKAFSVRAYAKKSFRMPTFNDLYYTEMGNAALQPESVVQYDMGLQYTKSFSLSWLCNINLQADGYYNTVHDKIIAYPKGQQFRWTMLNLGRVHITGIDALASITLKPMHELYVTGRLQYTYQDARDVTDASASYYRNQIPYIPYNSGSAIIGLQYRGWALNYSFIYSGERYNGQENSSYNHMEPWYTHDMSLQYQWLWGASKWKATAEVNNLMNQKYDVIANYPMPGINGAISLQIEL